MELYKADDYHEDFGNCIFFHFYSFEEPPDLCCGCPLDTEWDEEYWTHFIRFDFNNIFKKAMRMA